MCKIIIRQIRVKFSQTCAMIMTISAIPLKLYKIVIMIKMKPAAPGSSRELGYYNDIDQFQSAIKFILGDKIC